jgi:hypothetical protein
MSNLFPQISLGLHTTLRLGSQRRKSRTRSNPSLSRIKTEKPTLTGLIRKRVNDIVSMHVPVSLCQKRRVDQPPTKPPRVELLPLQTPACHRLVILLSWREGRALRRLRIIQLRMLHPLRLGFKDFSKLGRILSLRLSRKKRYQPLVLVSWCKEHSNRTTITDIVPWQIRFRMLE